MIIERIALVPYHIPFQQTLTTATTTTKLRHGWLLEVHTDTGIFGTGDIAPWKGFGGGIAKTQKELQLLTQMAPLPLPPSGKPFTGLRKLFSPEILFGWELAVLDIWCQINHCNMASLLGETPRNAIQVSQLVSTTNQAKKAKSDGITSFKVKVGAATIEQDIEHIRKIREVIGVKTKLCADANGKWSTQQALENLKRLEQFELSYVEQPIPPGNIEGLAYLKRHQNIRIAVDEGLTDLNALQQHLDQQAIDVAVLKPMFLGGFVKTRQMAVMAQKANIPVSVTTALESRIGRIATAHFCAATPAVSLPFGLGTALQEPNKPADRIHRGQLFIPNEPRLSKRQSKGVKIPNPLASAGRSRPNHTALVCQQRKLTFQQLTNQVSTLAYQLAPQIPPGSLVVLFGKPSVKWVLYWHALNWLGAIICPIDAACKKDEWNQCIDAVQPDGVICIDAVHFPIQGVRRIQPDVKRIGQQAERFWSLDDLRVVLFSSGSTGTPKPIPLRVSQLLFAAMGSALRLEHHQSDVWLCCLPVHHVGGLSILLRCSWYATTCVLHDRFDIAAIKQSIFHNRVSQISLVPTMLQKWLQTEDGFPTSVRLVLLGGAAPSAKLLQNCEQQRIPIHLTWGMTESAAQIATTHARTAQTAQCVGPPLAFATITPHPEGLIIQSPQTGEQPFHTKDVGEIDTQGKVWIYGRKDKIINSGGKLIDPKEVENALFKDENVLDAIVIGIPDQTWGQITAAALVYAAHKTKPTLEQLRNHCKQYISDFKAPKKVIWLSQIPRNQMGKIKYQQIVALFNEEQNNRNSHKL